MSTEKKVRITTLMILCVFTVALHLLPRPGYDTFISVFYNSFLIDIVLPCYLYLLLTMNVYSLPQKLKQKEMLVKILMGSAVFLVGFTVETLQYFDVPILGRTFDPLDYVMYFLGVIFGFAIDFGIISLSKRIQEISLSGGSA